MSRGGAWSRTARSRQASGLSRAEAAGRSQRAPPQAARETLTAHHVSDAPGNGGVFMSRGGAWSRTARSRQASGLSRAEAAGRSQRAPPQAARETLTAHHVSEASGDGSTCCARPVFNVSNTRQCVLSCCINLYRYDRVLPTTYAALPPVSRKEGTDKMNINAQQVSFRRQARRTNPRR